MSKLVFNKSTLKGFEKIPRSYPLPGSLDRNSINLIARIFFEQYSTYVEVLGWSLSKNEYVHIAAVVWKIFKNELYKIYLDKNNEYEILAGNLVKFTEYAYDYLNNSFFEYSTLLNPFINKKHISKKQQAELKKKTEELRIKKIRVSKSKTSKMQLIEIVIKEMEENGTNFNRAIRKHSTKDSVDYISDKSTISGWAKNQIKLHEDGLINSNSAALLKAQKLIYLKEKNKRNRFK